MSEDRGSKNHFEFVSLAKEVVTEIPFATTLFAVSVTFILLGTVSGTE